jgi:hypothetical protein
MVVYSVGMKVYVAIE